MSRVQGYSVDTTITDKAKNNDEKVSSDFRQINVGGSSNEFFCSNRVITAHYTIINWIPKSLIYQFSNLIMFYFLIICILVFQSFSPVTPWGFISVFSSVVLITMIKNGVEDIRRHKQDSQVNKALIKKYNHEVKGFINVECEKINVGDIIKVEEKQEIPADLVIIASSNKKGLAYIDTINLDGENALKEKMIMRTTEDIKNEADLDCFQAELYVDHPNKSLVKWNCNIKRGDSINAMSMKQFLLRGCFLKNTDWVYGIVIYTGIDTKIVMNNKKGNAKSSNIQKKLKLIVLSFIALLIFSCLLFAGLGKWWQDNNIDTSNYIDLPSADAGSVIIKSLTYFIQFAGIIPLSMYFVIEIQRLILSVFINNDLKMYYEPTDKATSVRSSDNIEELGQIEFLFSDKTGTLTCNEMTLIMCGIDNKIYGNLTSTISNNKELLNIVKNPESSEFLYIDRYFRLLILCHSVFPTIHDGVLIYQATSPDEVAFVEAAKSLGYELKERNEDKIIISAQEQVEEWKIIAELPFTPDRKRMSVIIENNDHQLIIFTKGADTVMMPLIINGNHEKISEQLKNFGQEGLRTLVMAGKNLKQEEFLEWQLEWKEVLLINSKDKDEMIDLACQKIEKELEFFGTSAIEDKLQQGVHETVDLLIDAGIRLWMLTGDKEETAIEIAKSCNLLKKNMELITIFDSSFESISEILMELDKSYGYSTKTFEQLEIFKNDLKIPIALAINGVAFTLIKNNCKLSQMYFKLAFISSTCICCRFSPSQKYEVVRLCKENGPWITLAIGDGANDVNMIQEAHVGVGISGKEGTQAVLASEYSISQFAHLKYLLLVHGRYTYSRISLFILYFFYQNFAMEVSAAWLTFYCGFSGQIYYLDWIPAFLNFFWTSWPSLAFITLDQDVPPEVSCRYPSLYSISQKSALFNIKIFWIWIIFGFHSAAWIFWLPMASLSKGTGLDGYEPQLFWISTVSFIMLIHVLFIKMLLMTRSWTIISM